MSMTREELRQWFAEWLDDYYDGLYSEDDLTPEVAESVLAALRPVSREQVEKVWRGCEYCGEEWGTCNPITNRFTMPPRGCIRLCPMCGKPLTDEAVDMVMKRLEALYEQTKAD